MWTERRKQTRLSIESRGRDHDDARSKILVVRYVSMVSLVCNVCKYRLHSNQNNER